MVVRAWGRSALRHPGLRFSYRRPLPQPERTRPNLHPASGGTAGLSGILSLQPGQQHQRNRWPSLSHWAEHYSECARRRAYKLYHCGIRRGRHPPGKGVLFRCACARRAAAFSLFQWRFGAPGRAFHSLMFSVSKIEHYLISKTDGTWIFPSMCLFRASFAKEQQRRPCIDP